MCKLVVFGLLHAASVTTSVKSTVSLAQGHFPGKDSQVVPISHGVETRPAWGLLFPAFHMPRARVFHQPLLLTLFTPSPKLSRTFLTVTPRGQDLSWTMKSNGPGAAGASPALPTHCAHRSSQATSIYLSSSSFCLSSSFPLSILPPSSLPILSPFPSIGSSPITGSELAAPISLCLP